MSARSNDSKRAETAAKIMKALSRPGTTQSRSASAWKNNSEESKSADPEKGIRPKTAAEFNDPFLEEELASADKSKGNSKDDGPKGCWDKVSDFVSQIWSTTDMLSGEERETNVRTSTRELAIYILFLTVLVIVTLSATSATMFRYTKTLKGIFGSYEDVAQISDLWNYLEGDLIDGLYEEEWYNLGTDKPFPCPDGEMIKGKPCPVNPKKRMILGANRLLGVPRMRLLRVRNDSCIVPNDFKEAITVCYDSYSPGIEEKSKFEPNYFKYTSRDAWRYQGVKELEGYDWWGLLATYSGAGSVESLSLVKEETAAKIRELKESIWIRRGTRYISLDFTLYNANVNLFCVIKINFEFPPTGGIVPDGSFKTVRLLRYITKSDYVLMGLEIVLFALVIYFLIEEAIEIRSMGFEYIKSFWNCVDLCVIGIATATLGFNVYEIYHASYMLKGLLAEPEVFTDFSDLAGWSKIFQNCAGVSIFLGLIKIFKYISFNKTMSILSGTLTRSLPDLGAFTIMFFIQFFSFAQFAYLIFGTHMEQYSTLTSCIYTQFRMVLGDFDFPAMRRAHAFLGPTYFFVFIFLVFFILMNMFMAILNDTYSEVKEDVENRREDFQMMDFLARGYNNILETVSERDKMIDIQEVVKLAADDGVVTYEEIRESLRKKNFSETEIEILVSKYDVDGNTMFTVNEINAIQDGDPSRLEEENQNEEDVQLHEEDIPKLKTFDQGMFDELTLKVDQMEENMADVAEKVSSVLTKLDSYE